MGNEYEDTISEESKLNDKQIEEIKEWEKKVFIAIYKGLNIRPISNYEKNMLVDLRKRLLDCGITEEEMEKIVSEYKKLSEEERRQEIEEKVEALVLQINTFLEGKEEISSDEYPELYHRIQELIALNEEVGNELINKAFARENINKGLNCGGRIYGRECAYLFSKTLRYQ